MIDITMKLHTQNSAYIICLLFTSYVCYNVLIVALCQRMVYTLITFGKYQVLGFLILEKYIKYNHDHDHSK